MVDAFQTEFQQYLSTDHRPHDMLCLPLDGGRWKQARYRWETAGYASVHTATWQTLLRSLAARRLKAYGAERLQAQLAEHSVAERNSLAVADRTGVVLAFTGPAGNNINPVESTLARKFRPAAWGATPGELLSKA
jgi:hypothetical protein